MTQDVPGRAGEGHAPNTTGSHDQMDIPVPETDPAYTMLAKILQKAARQMGFLDLTGLDYEDLRVARSKARLTTLTDLSATIDFLSKLTAVDSIRNGDMSRVQASEILGVHQATVARWVKEREADEADRPPASVSDEPLTSAAQELPRQSKKKDKRTEAQNTLNNRRPNRY